MAVLAGVPERPKGAGCKPAGSAYEGSNPSPCIFSRPGGERARAFRQVHVLLETRLSAGGEQRTDGPPRDLRIWMSPAHDVRVQDRLAQPHVEVRQRVEVPLDLVLAAAESLGKDLAVERDRSLMHAAGGVSSTRTAVCGSRSRKRRNGPCAVTASVKRSEISRIASTPRLRTSRRACSYVRSARLHRTSPSRRSRPSTARYSVARLTASSWGSSSMSIVPSRRNCLRAPATMASYVITRR